MKKFKTRGLQYIPGDFCVTQGHKCGERAHYSRRGAYVNPIGFGNATETRPSRLLLAIDAGDEVSSVRIDDYFKERGKRLTQKRIERLEETMPDKVTLIRQVSCYGNEYITVDEDEMKKWCKKAGIKM